MDRIASLRVLLLVTSRPEFVPPWIGLSHVTALTITRLPKGQIDAMIDGVIGNRFLPANIRHDIIERTDGTLLVEEMTKAVLEAESASDAQRIAAAIPAPASAVPASLQASLMARLDRLGPAEQVAQIGAIIGREFSYTLLARVVRKSEAELRSALERLVEAGLLFRRGMPPDETYLFKHALVQDAASSTLLRRRRQELHGCIVSVMQCDFPEVIVGQPEILAHHCAEAGMVPEAIEYYLLASQHATAASNNVEASAHLRRGLVVCEQLPASDARKAQFRDRLAAGGWWLGA